MKIRSAKYFKDNKRHDGLGKATLRSGALLVSVRLFNVVVQLGSTILLARLLGPDEFGLATIVLSMTMFAPILIDLGTTDAATQKTQITSDEISTLFWLNVVMGAVLTAIFAAASGLIASLFREPALADIAVWSSLTFLLTGLSVQHYALMRRAMEFDRIAVIDISANVISSIVSILMALTGWGYWALVMKPLLLLGLTAIGAWISCHWVPGRPHLNGAVKQMIRFGLGVTGFTMTDHLTRSADRLAIGYFYGPGPLGFFQNAFLLYSNLISLLAESLHSVAVSALSKLREDNAGLKRAWSSALSMVTFVSCAIFAVLAVTAQDFVVMLLGEKWSAVGPLLTIFAIRGIAHGAERTLGWLHIVAGRSDRWMRWGFISAAVQLLALAAGLPFGPIGVATAYAIATFALFVPALVYSGRPLGIDVGDVLSAVGPQVTAGVVAAIAAYAFQTIVLADYHQFIRFPISITFCLAIYFFVAVGLFRVTEPLRLGWSVMADLVANRPRQAS